MFCGFSIPTFFGLPEETLSKIADVLEEVSWYFIIYKLIKLASTNRRIQIQNMSIVHLDFRRHAIFSYFVLCFFIMFLQHKKLYLKIILAGIVLSVMNENQVYICTILCLVNFTKNLK